MKNKVIAMIVVLALMASSLVVTNVVAERKVEVDGSGNAHWILSNDGFGRPDWNLTVGEVITLQITNNSLGKNTNYKV
ncbi:MAG: hypothetical protein QCI00_09380, partial [Candidatus Thermoplasmatota archaeon]|nr:hypothetical protein [Candidatus Thermoplasmatota archaeon]